MGAVPITPCPSGSSTNMTRITVLYVDDEPDLLELGKTFLEATGNFNVDTRQSATEGMDTLRAHPYDAIISDYQMPDMDGLAFLKAVRFEFSDLPFILFTGRGREDVVIDAINYGVDFYLQKGGDVRAQFAELAHKITMAVERKRAIDERIESENRLSTIFHASPIHQMITEFGSDRIIDINDRFLKDLHRSRDEVIGRTSLEIGLMPDPETMARFRAELSESGIVRNVPVSIRGRNGKVYTSLTSMTAVRVHGRDLVYTQSVDITAQKKAQQTINALLNAPRDVSMLLDPAGKILAVNHAASERYGLTAAELTGRDAYSLLSPDYAPKRREGVEVVLRTGNPWAFIDDQSGRVFENNLYPVLDELGNVTAIAVYSHDATDDIAAKQALRISEEKYRLVVENSHDTIYIHRDNKFLFINNRAEDLTGFTHEELMKRDIWDFLHPDDRDRLKGQAMRRFSGGEISSQFEARILRKNGEIRNGEFFVDIVDFLGRPAILGIARDITEKKRAEEAIRDREAQLRALSDNLPSGMVYQVVLNPDGTRQFLHVSAGVRTLHEVSAEEVLRDARILYDQIHPDDRMGFLDAENRALAIMSPLNCQARVRTPSGRERWGLIRSAPRRLADGRIVWDGIELDITAAKEAEDELKAAYEQLAASQEELRGQFEALQEGQAMLAESEGKYRTLVEHTEDGVFVAQDGNIVFVNEALANRVGYLSGELIGRSFAGLVAPEDRQMVVSRHHARLAGADLTDDYEFSLLHKDDRATSRVRIRVGTGTYNGRPAVIGTLHDVTEERAQQAALRESEARFRGLTEQSLDTIMLFDRKLRHIYVSPMAEKISGIPSEKFLMKTHAELGFPPHLVTLWEDVLRKVFTTGRTNRIEFMLPASGIWIDWQLVPVRGPDGEVAEVIASSRDITDRKKIEEALRDSEEKYRDLVENASIIILKWDKSGNITFFNKYAQRFFGYIEEEIMGKSVVGTIVPPTESSTGRDLRCMIDDIIRNPAGHIENENENITRDGRRVWIRWHNKPLYDKNGEFAGQICIGTDNTGRKKAEEALTTSEELHRKLIATIPDVVVTADLEGNITFINDQGVRLAGAPDAAAVTGKSVFSFFAPECLEMAKENTKRMFEGLLGPMEYVFLSGDNSRVVLEVNGDVLRAPDGKPYGFVYVCRDITERRQAQDAIRHSEELYRSLAEASPDGIAILDIQGYLSYVSPRALALFGLSDPSEALGTHVLEWIDPADRAVALERFTELSEKKILTNHVYRMQRRDGSGFSVEMHSSLLHDRKGEISGIVSILRDITERLNAGAALQKSEENYRHIIENMQDVFYRTDNLGNITMISKYGARLMGYDSPADVIGKVHASDFYINKDERQALLECLHREGAVTGFPVTLRGRDGIAHAATASSRLLYDAGGNFSGVEGILHDVTALKDVENALRQANRQLTLMNSITQHDIRNQLLALEGLLEISRGSVGDPDRMIALIEKEQKIASIIGEQIEFFTLFDSMGVLPPAWQDPGTLVTRSGRALVSGNVRLKIDMPRLEVFADPLLEKVFYNILDNSLRYAGPMLTKISVSAEESEQGLVIIVADDGCGIAHEDKQRVFHRGFGENTGLGLFLVREILAITGITIRETGSPGNGVRFEISVPLGRYRFASSLSTS